MRCRREIDKEYNWLTILTLCLSMKRLCDEKIREVSTVLGPSISISTSEVTIMIKLCAEF